MQTALLTLVVLAVAAHLVLGGLGAARLAVQLPARHRLGPVAFARYARAADLGNGLYLYPALGIGGPLAAWAALAVTVHAHARAAVVAPLAVAAALSVLHVLTTARAAPTMIRVGRTEDRADLLAPLLDRFARWSWLRAVLQALTAAVLLWALLAIRPGTRISSPPLLAVTLAAVSLLSVLAGGALDNVIVQYPVRRAIGTAAYAGYLRAADLANGRVFYPIVGLSSNVATIAAFALALGLATPPLPAALLGVATACGVAAFLVTRTVIRSAGRLAADPGGGSTDALVERFVANGQARAPLFALAFGCLLAVLVVR